MAMMLTGWKCNECGKVNAPWVAECPGYHSVPTITYPIQIYPCQPYYQFYLEYPYQPFVWTDSSNDIRIAENTNRGA